MEEIKAIVEAMIEIAKTPILIPFEIIFVLGIIVTKGKKRG